jgi:ABC-type Fe3+-hydroxamate transport system substrate-binding protein
MTRVVQRAPAPWVALVVVAAALGGCGRGAGQVPAPTPRVVSLVPAASAIIDALGAKAHLVGVTRYCAVTGPPVIGGMDARPEAVLAQDPDLVVLGDYPSQAALREQLTALGLNAVAPSFVGIDDLRAAVTRLGAALGREAAAAALVAALDRDLALAKERAASRRPVKVLLVYDVQQGYVYTTGGGDHLGALLDLCGARNIAQGGPLTTRLALDAVLARGPELILHVAPGEAYPDDAAARAYWKSLPEVPAVRAGHVYVWPDDHLAQNGPWIGAAALQLSDLLDRVAGAP